MSGSVASNVIRLAALTDGFIGAIVFDQRPFDLHGLRHSMQEEQHPEREADKDALG